MSKNGRWPLGIGIVVVLFVLSLIVFLVFALNQRVNLVEDDYYEKDLRYQQQIERIQRTRKEAAQPEVRYIKTSRQLYLRFRLKNDPQSLEGTLHIFRPSDSRMDRKIPLKLNAQAIQFINLSDLPPGYWKLKLDWVNGGAEYYHEQDLIIE